MPENWRFQSTAKLRTGQTRKYADFNFSYEIADRNWATVPIHFLQVNQQMVMKGNLAAFNFRRWNWLTQGWRRWFTNILYTITDSSSFVWHVACTACHNSCAARHFDQSYRRCDFCMGTIFCDKAQIENVCIHWKGTISSKRKLCRLMVNIRTRFDGGKVKLWELCPAPATTFRGQFNAFNGIIEPWVIRAKWKWCIFYGRKSTREGRGDSYRR